MAIESSSAPPSKEDKVEILSRLAGPISQLDFLQASFLFAELSHAAYYAKDRVAPAAALSGFAEVEFFERDGAQAFLLATPTDCIVVCRGTEVSDWNDVKADINMTTVLEYTVGRVHSGFKREVDDLWPKLERALQENNRPVWFTGHSLGGAMATICAGRCKLASIPSNPSGLVTFGSPRVGNSQYINFVEVKHFRWVNNNDIVARVPPRWMGYRHGGREVYINSQGKLKKLLPLSRFSDRCRGVFESAKQWKIDYLIDHSMNKYIAAIQNAIEWEKKVKPLEALATPRKEWKM